MKNGLKISLFLILTLLTSKTLANTANAEAINEVMDNIEDPNRVESKLGMTEEDVLDMEAESEDGEFGIKNIHKRIRALKRRWNRIKDSPDLTDEEKKIVKEHLDDLVKLRKVNSDSHEKIHALLLELSGIENQLSAKVDGDL